MSSIGSIGGNQNQFNPINQTTGTGSTGHSSGTSGTSAPTGGVSGHTGPLPPVMQELQTLMTDLSALLFAPTSSTPSTSNPSGQTTGTDTKVGSKSGEHHHHHAGGAKGSTDSTATGSSTTTPTESMESLVTALWNTTDGTVDQLSKVIIEQATQESQEAQEQAQADSNAAKSDLLAQAGQLRKEANDMRAAAVVSLVMTVVASAISIGGAMKSMKMSKDSDSILNGAEEHNSNVLENIKLNKENPGTLKDMQVVNTKAGNEGARANATGQIYQAVSGMVNGLGTFVSTMVQAEEKDTEAIGDEYAAQAQDLNTQSQMQQKTADGMNKLIDQITDLIKEMGDAKAQMMQSMTRV